MCTILSNGTLTFILNRPGLFLGVEQLTDLPFCAESNFQSNSCQGLCHRRGRFPGPYIPESTDGVSPHFCWIITKIWTSSLVNHGQTFVVYATTNRPTFLNLKGLSFSLSLPPPITIWIDVGPDKIMFSPPKPAVSLDYSTMFWSHLLSLFVSDVETRPNRQIPDQTGSQNIE